MTAKTINLRPTVEERLDRLEESLKQSRRIMEDIVSIMERQNGIRRPRHLTVIEPDEAT